MVVEGEVWSGQVQLQPVLRAGQVQSAGFLSWTLALLENVGDILAGERLEGEGVLQGLSHRLGSLKLAPGGDLLDVRLGVEAPLFQRLVIIVSLRAKGPKAHEALLIARLLALQPQGLPGVG